MIRRRRPIVLAAAAVSFCLLARAVSAGDESPTTTTGSGGGSGGTVASASPSTEMSPDESRALALKAAAELGVRPPAYGRGAPAFVRRFFFKLEGRVLSSVVHRWFDRCRPPNSKLSLQVLWWKAISGNDPSSPVCDGGLAYDLLPGGFRWPARRMARLYPRWVHAVVEIRTAYLDRAVTRIAEGLPPGRRRRVRLVSLGAGYDVRSVKMKLRNVIQEACELDLPQVVEAKRRMLQSKRFCRRRPGVAEDALPQFYPVDLNQIDQVKETLEAILRQELKSGEGPVHTIFLFEAVMLYLNKGVPSALLGACREALGSTQQTGSLCFADHLEHVSGVDEDVAAEEMSRRGWKLVEWLPKGGKTRHMGRAEMLL